MAHFPTFKNLKGVNISNLNVRHVLPELDELPIQVVSKMALIFKFG